MSPLSPMLRPEGRKRLLPVGVAERVTRPSEGQEGGHVTASETSSCLGAVTQTIQVSESLKSPGPHPHVLSVHHAVTLQWRWNSPASSSPKHPPGSCHIRTGGKKDQHQCLRGSHPSRHLGCQIKPQKQAKEQQVLIFGPV